MCGFENLGVHLCLTMFGEGLPGACSVRDVEYGEALLSNAVI